MRRRPDPYVIPSCWATIIGPVIGAVLVVTAVLVATAPAAGAAVALSVTVSSPAAVTVGQSGLSGMVVVQNVSTPPQATGQVMITAVTLVPSCGGVPAAGGDCPATLTDPGVFQLAATAMGEAATACAGVAFTVKVVDQAEGQVSFVPSSFVAPITLGPLGSGTDTCGIDFTFGVAKVPTHDAAATSGIQTDLLVSATGTYQGANQSAISVTASASSLVTVNPNKSPTTLTAKSTPTAAPGGQISDVATLSAAPAPAPTGTITFNAYGPADTTCSAAPVFTDQQAVSAAGSFTSTAFTPRAPGSYRFRAGYSGDAGHAPITTACGDPSEISTVGKASPTIATVASLPVAVGGGITATATLTGASSAVSGSLTFVVYGPDDATCSASPAFTDTEPVATNGSTTSPSFTPTTPGTYQFVVSFAGDADDKAVASACNAAGSTVAVSAVAAVPTTVTINPGTASGPPVGVGVPVKRQRLSGTLVAVGVAALGFVLVAMVIYLRRRRTATRDELAEDSRRQEEVMRDAVEDIYR